MHFLNVSHTVLFMYLYVVIRQNIDDCKILVNIINLALSFAFYKFIDIIITWDKITFVHVFVIYFVTCVFVNKLTN